MQAPVRILFIYWGRRGALSRFTLDLMRVAISSEGLHATLSISRQNERYDIFEQFGDALLLVSTFYSNPGGVIQAWRIPAIRRQIGDHIRRHKIDAVVSLMPHVWLPLVSSAIHHAGAAYISIVHDADPHPGDHTTAVHDWVLRDIHTADRVITLSRTVTDQLEASKRVPSSRITTLFHPDLSYGPLTTLPPPKPGTPLRVGFFGRIMRYKGLALFVDTVEQLHRSGLPLEIGVFGEGEVQPYLARLEALGAKIINRWLTEEEIGSLLPGYHAVILSHIEASQSGVAAMSMGMGVPVVATPVGGLREQVIDGETGVLAASATATALASAIRRLADEPGLHERIARNLATSRDQRSMSRFVANVVHETAKLRGNEKS